MGAGDENRCTYTHDLTDTSYFTDLDGDEWHCPRSTHGDHDRCLFHMDPTDRDVEPEAVATRLRELVESQANSSRANQQHRFIGATFEGLDFQHLVLDGPDTRPIDLREARFIGQVNFANTVLGHPLRASGAVFEADVDFTACETRYAMQFDGATFEKMMVFDDASFGSLDCRDVRIEQLCRCRRMCVTGEVDFKDAAIQGLTFEEAMIDDALYLNDTHCQRRIRLDGTDIGGVVTLNRGVFENGLWAAQVAIGDGLLVNDTQLGGAVHFQDAEIKGTSRMHTAMFASVAEFRNATFQSLSVSPASIAGELRFDHAQFAELSLANVSVEDTLSLADVAVTETAELQQVSFHDVLTCRSGDFARLIIDDPSSQSEQSLIDLRGATIEEGQFGQSANGVVYDLEKATVGAVTLADGPSRRPLEWYRFLRTDFVNFDFSSHKLSLADSGWQLYRHDGPYNSRTRRKPAAVDLEVTYLKAKNGASRSGDSEAASYFYRKEMQYRRRKYLSQFQTDPRYRRRIKAGSLATFNLFMGATTGHGELARRVVASSFVVIGVFALAYWQFLSLPLATGDGIVDYVALSTQVFLTFVLGTSVETPSLGLTLTAAVEGFLGAFFIALFVFTLTRSIKR